MKHNYKIDLLPDHIKRERVGKTIFRRSLFWSFLIISIFIAANILLWIWQYTYELDQASMRKDIEKTEQDITKLSKSETELIKLKQKYVIYTTITKQRMLPQDIVAKLSAITPKEVTIQSLNVDKVKKPNISFSGKANTRRDVVIFAEALNKSDTFTNAEFSSTNQSAGSDEDSSESITFSMTLDLK